MDLFSLNEEKISPLAERMRAKSFDEFYGQEHIVKKDSLLYRAVVADKLGSCIFYGPPGTGKTTLANIISNQTKGEFVKLNAVTCGIADVKKVIETGKNNLMMFQKKTYLLLDECHRFNKTQLDSMLYAIEKGYIIFIGSTTENPYYSLTPALVSRSRVFEFKKLKDEDIRKALIHALEKDEILRQMNLKVEKEAIEHFVWASDGDLRCALNALELAALTTNPAANGDITVSLKDAESSIQKKALSVDETLYYDMLSAFCKSLRGSDPDSAIYYAQRLIDAGLDPRIILRRTIAHSCEDVGMADPNALVVATNALLAFEKLGLPEGNLPIAEAVIYVALAPKSNSVYLAMHAANEDIANKKDDNVPLYLREMSYKRGAEREAGKSYKYPHDYGGYVKQQYLPDSLKDRRYYKPSNNGLEKNIKIRKDED